MIIPTLISSVTDSPPSYKMGVAIALSQISGWVGKSLTSEKILPVLMELLKEDNADVKEKVVLGF